MHVKNGKVMRKYLAGQLDFTTKPRFTSVFMQLQPVYHSLAKLPYFPCCPFPLSRLIRIELPFKPGLPSPKELSMQKDHDGNYKSKKLDWSPYWRSWKATCFCLINEFLFHHEFITPGDSPEKEYHLQLKIRWIHKQNRNYNTKRQFTCRGLSIMHKRQNSFVANIAWALHVSFLPKNYIEEIT